VRDCCSTDVPGEREFGIFEASHYDGHREEMMR
jgi:hypothetical protein